MQIAESKNLIKKLQVFLSATRNPKIFCGFQIAEANKFIPDFKYYLTTRIRCCRLRKSKIKIFVTTHLLILFYHSNFNHRSSGKIGCIFIPSLRILVFKSLEVMNSSPILLVIFTMLNIFTVIFSLSSPVLLFSSCPQVSFSTLGR